MNIWLNKVCTHVHAGSVTMQKNLLGQVIAIKAQKLFIPAQITNIKD
jgi:hypothetical protein